MIGVKKEKDEIRESFTFDYTELTAIEEYLAEQEQQGWRLKEIDGKNFVFERAEPRKIRYTAEIYTSAFPTDFIAACEEEGWEYAAVYHDELFIFRTHNTDATEIMTDEKDKFKTIAKRVLLQPGYLGFSGWAFYRFLDIFVSGTSLDNMIETSVSDCLGIVFIASYITYTLLKLLDFAVWFIKGKKSVKKGEKIPFLTLKEHKQNSIAHWVMVALFSVFYFAVSVLLQAGYTDSSWQFWLHGAFPLVIGVMCVYALDGKKRTDEKSSKAVHVVAVIVAAVIIAGVYGTVQYSRQKYAENSKTMLNYEGIPVSFSDLGFEKESCTDESVVYATSLVQFYYFDSESEQADEEDYFRSWFDYQVFVSDYEFICKKYINEIFEYHEKYDNIVVQVHSDDTSWDQCWHVSYGSDNEYENLYSGFAVKDNIVIILDGYVQTKGQDFFEVAYEKLFGEKEVA